MATRCPPAARALDLLLVLVALPVAAPLGLLISLAILLDSPGPVLFRSRRVGPDGRRFEMVKFRTMRHPAAGPSVSSRGDIRYTPFGRFLAGSRMDELPQLWHVLRGQMRLVGPRPELEEFVLGQADSYRTILSVPPGVTGPTQLVFADEGKVLALAEDPEHEYLNSLLPRKVELDLRYVASRTVGKDLAVLARTCLVPLRRFSTVMSGFSAPTRRRVGLVLFQAASLVLAAIVMVAIFAFEGAAAL